MIPLIYVRYPKQANSQRWKEQRSWVWKSDAISGWGRGVGSYYLIGTEFLFEKMKNFSEWIVVMVGQHCKCT